MAFHKNLVKEWYKDLSVEELEEKYYALQGDYYFEDKEKQIAYMISTFLNASHNVNKASAKWNTTNGDPITDIADLINDKIGSPFKFIKSLIQLNILIILLKLILE